MRTAPRFGALAALLASLVLALVPATAGAVIPPQPPAGEEEGGEEQQPIDAVLVPDRTGAVTPAVPLTWAGAVASGTNQTFDPLAPNTCAKAPETYCDITLVDVQPGDFYSARGRGVQFSIGGATPGTDLDLYVYESDASGRVGALVGLSGGITDVERVPLLGATGHFLIVVVYYSATETGYTGAAEFFRRNTVPADVDSPRGLRDVLVSRPSRGFRSQSEPHVSQDPTNPRILVGGSKMYNRDRDSLAEYEFKIGTYASFDRGRTWTDLGQLNTCPLAQAPRRTWPLRNTCYPADDPARAGTGAEDAPDDRRGGDLGEEYTTSDVWTDFDDEGNAYAMVLDAPPFSGDSSGNGFGMSFHRWPTPSARDVRRGRTWSRRIPINAYTTPEEQASTLDDKNTFAVNNAGPDGDGRTGIIVACWGLNDQLETSPRQFIVCERSVDGGRTWPGDPQPISPPLNPPLPVGPFVVGVHVIADPRDPRTFYAVWLDTLVGFLDGTGLQAFWFARTTDGARTWEPARVITRLPSIPGLFPRQSFRNLSIPIMAAGPSRGELYVAYADYSAAPDPETDEDGLQADIKLLRSRNAGVTWSDPRRVNTDATNADQFQPYVRVTPRGQVNVAFFDRRFDAPEPPAHPGNFFVDTVLARSDDGGRTFRETRLSHDSWDPSLNPPISPSGEFIGDYQGLVADDCLAIPFFNDAHLANAAGRDPGLDAGKPRSQFQQVVAWRVPNRPAFGGRRADC
ncbi:MAG TPA: sialidase family protein [Solirubrobacteraceae bacterium]|nr:sialidase family protein [Solirubrobacteraceae bacterium]